MNRYRNEETGEVIELVNNRWVVVERTQPSDAPPLPPPGFLRQPSWDERLGRGMVDIPTGLGQIADYVSPELGEGWRSMVQAVGRNPSARDAVFPIGILGFALTEAVALFALLIAFLILFT